MITYWTKKGCFESHNGSDFDFMRRFKDLHRLDGPAIEYPDGTKIWYINGKTHRLDGPAIENPDGTKEWHVNGKLHRIDGPAIVRVENFWWLNNKCFILEEFVQQTPYLTNDAERLSFYLRWK